MLPKPIEFPPFWAEIDYHRLILEDDRVLSLKIERPFYNIDLRIDVVDPTIKPIVVDDSLSHYHYSVLVTSFGMMRPYEYLTSSVGVIVRKGIINLQALIAPSAAKSLNYPRQELIAFTDHMMPVIPLTPPKAEVYHATDSN